MLDRLSDVQAFDLRLDDLREERGKTPPELIEIRERKALLEAKLADLRHDHEELRKQVSQNELELRTLDARRKEASEASLRADSAKEASQYQNQELQFATRLQELEEDTLPLMEQMESLQERIDELKDKLEELEPQLDELAAEEDARVSGIDRQIGTVTEDRRKLADDIDSGLLRQYEQVRRARRGVGLVEIVENARCGGCHVRLPIHVIQKARRGSAVVRCPSCGRILWDRND